MNKFIKGLTLGLLIGAAAIGIITIKQPKQTEVPTEEIKIIKTLTESADDVWLENEGDVYQELSNGSWLIYNELNDTYIFQAIELEGWNYTCSSKEELDNMVNDYINIKNK